MSSAGEHQATKFAQTFFLAEQPEGYYVLNDIFRFLKEDFDDDSLQTDSAKPAANSAPPANNAPQKEIKVELKQQPQKTTQQQPQKQPATSQQPQKVAPVPESPKTPVKQESPESLQKAEPEKAPVEKNPTPTPAQPKSWAALVNNPPNASQTRISTPAPVAAASSKPAAQPKKESIKATTDQPNSQESKQQTNSQDSKQLTNSQETNGEFRPVQSRRNDEKYRRTDGG